MLIRKYHKLMGKAKEYSSDSPAAGTRFLQRPIFALAGFCSWDLFGGGLWSGAVHMVGPICLCLQFQVFLSRAF